MPDLYRFSLAPTGSDHPAPLSERMRQAIDAVRAHGLEVVDVVVSVQSPDPFDPPESMRVKRWLKAIGTRAGLRQGRQRPGLRARWPEPEATHEV